MSQDVLLFPPEIREIVYGYCSKSDLLNVACCCKVYCSSVKYLLWRTVKLSWRTIEKQSLDSILENLHFARSLIIDVSGNKNEDDNSRLNKWTHISSNYENLLKHCNSKRLVKLDFNGVITDDGVKKTVDVLRNLHELVLSDSRFVSASGFQLISSLSQLRKLSLRNSRIVDTDIEKITTLLRLEELHLDRCTEIRDESLTHISNASGLKKLTISNNYRIAASAFKQLGKLERLVLLNVEDTSIDGQSLMYCCQHLQRLRTLNIGGCNNITDEGFCNIRLLTSLEVLEIHMCNNITDLIFDSLCALMFLRKLSISLNSKVTVDTFSPISHSTSLRELIIVNPNRRFSAVEIDKFCKKTGMRTKLLNMRWLFSFLTLVKDI